MAVKLTSQTLENTVLMIGLDGSLDAPATIDIEAEFQGLLHGAHPRVIVDLSNLEYMSSYGLRMLLLGAKALGDSGGQLHLASPNERVMELISLAGYDTMFPVHESVDDAVHFLGQ